MNKKILILILVILVVLIMGIVVGVTVLKDDGNTTQENENQINNEEIVSRYKNNLVMNERMPDILSGAMGNYTYTARFETMDEVNSFINAVLQEVNYESWVF